MRDVDGDTSFDTANSLVRDLPKDVNLIVDVTNMLERDKSARYRKFLNDLQIHMVNTRGLIVFHGPRGESVPGNRDLTEHMADMVFDLDTKIDGSETISRPVVPKFRGGRALDKTTKFRLAKRVSVDTSHDVA